MNTDFYSRLSFFLYFIYLIAINIYFSVRWKKKIKFNRFKSVFIIIIGIGYVFNLYFVKIFTLSSHMVFKWTGFITAGIGLFLWTLIKFTSDGEISEKLKLSFLKSRIKYIKYSSIILWGTGISILTTNLLFISYYLIILILFFKKHREGTF